MESIVLQNTPGWYYAFAYWLAAILFIRVNPRRRKGFREAAVSVLFLFVIVGFAVVSDTGREELFFLTAGVVVALLYLFLYVSCAFTPANAGYFCIRAFILGEFSASLEWQLYYFVMRIWPQHWLWLNLLMLLMTHALVFFFMYLLERRYRNYNRKLRIGRRELLPALLIALGMYMLSNISFTWQNTPFSGDSISAIFIIRTVVDLGGVVMLFAYHMQMEDISDKMEIGILQQMLESQYANYRMSEQSIALVNQKYHDLKHQIAFLRQEIDSGEKKKYLDRMEEELSSFEAHTDTGSRVLDTILTSKLLLCRSQGIEMTCMADGKTLDFMSPMDLSALFGNALDNAVESAAQIADREKRWIHVEVRKKENFVVVSVGNSCAGEVSFSDGLPQTTKQDRRYHGFGTKSIRHTAERYGGTVMFDARNGWFRMRAVFPVQ